MSVCRRGRPATLVPESALVSSGEIRWKNGKLEEYKDFVATGLRRIAKEMRQYEEIPELPAPGTWYEPQIFLPNRKKGSLACTYQGGI